MADFSDVQARIAELSSVLKSTTPFADGRIRSHDVVEVARLIGLEAAAVMTEEWPHRDVQASWAGALLRVEACYAEVLRITEPRTEQSMAGVREFLVPAKGHEGAPIQAAVDLALAAGHALVAAAQVISQIPLTP